MMFVVIYLQGGQQKPLVRSVSGSKVARFCTIANTYSFVRTKYFQTPTTFSYNFI